MILSKVQYTDSENKEIEVPYEEYEKLSDKEQENYWQRYGEITQAALNRYILSLGGSKTAIISDVKEILEAVTLDDFRQWQKDNNHLPTVTEHEEEYEQFCILLFGLITDQLEAVAFYKLPLEEMGEKISDLIHKAAAVHFTKPVDFEFHLISNNTPKRKRGNITAAVKDGERTTLYSSTGFNTIRQGAATNALTKVKANPKYNTVIDPITGTATISQGSLIITIPGFTELAGFKTSTYQLLGALTVKLTETGAKSPVVALLLEEYMEKRGLKDKKEARKQAAADLEILFNAKISFKEKRKKGKEPDFHDIRIIDSKGIKNGIITVSFGTTFYNILLGYPVMPYPVQLWTLNSKHNPNSFYLLRKIAEHKNMNVGKKNEDIIAVKTLLSIAPDIPTYEEVMATDRALTRRIMDTFERDMDALEETLTWTYCHSNNTPLTDEELKTLDYNTFIDLLIRTNWKNYPDQTARLERKAERQEQAKQRKRKKSTKQKE